MADDTDKQGLGDETAADGDQEEQQALDDLTILDDTSDEDMDAVQQAGGGADGSDIDDPNVLSTVHRGSQDTGEDGLADLAVDGAGDEAEAPAETAETGRDDSTDLSSALEDAPDAGEEEETEKAADNGSQPSFSVGTYGLDQDSAADAPGGEAENGETPEAAPAAATEVVVEEAATEADEAPVEETDVVSETASEAVNAAPEVSGDTSASLNEDGSLTITQEMLTANASDVDGDALTASNLSADNGTITDNGDGTYTFAPDANWNGELNISYDVSDGTTTTSTNMDVSVDGVADAPTLSATLGSVVSDTGQTLAGGKGADTLTGGAGDDSWTVTKATTPSPAAKATTRFTAALATILWTAARATTRPGATTATTCSSSATATAAIPSTAAPAGPTASNWRTSAAVRAATPVGRCRSRTALPTPKPPTASNSRATPPAPSSSRTAANWLSTVSTRSSGRPRPRGRPPAAFPFSLAFRYTPAKKRCPSKAEVCPGDGKAGGCLRSGGSSRLALATEPFIGSKSVHSIGPAAAPAGTNGRFDRKGTMADKDEQRLPSELRATVAGALKGKDAASEFNRLFDGAAAFLADRIESIKKQSPPAGALDCGRGRAHCCYQYEVAVTFLEVFRLADHIEKTFAAAGKEALLERLADIKKRKDEHPPDRKPKKMFRSPLLIDDQCAVYEVRPFVCRGANSYSARECELAKRTGREQKVVHAYRPQDRAARLVRKTVALGGADAGLDARMVDLTRALHIVLTTPGARKRWLERRLVFTPAKSRIGRKAAKIERIGKYAVHGELVSTDYSTIYLCRDPILTLTSRSRSSTPRTTPRGRRKAMDGPYWRSRFLTEARIMARFEHPHIVAVKELSALADGTPFFVMPFIEANLIDEMGTDAADPGVIAGLAEKDRPRRLAPERSLSLLRQLLAALAAVHRAGMVHRDVKPGNILLTRKRGGSVKLCDFGMVKFPGWKCSRYGLWIGTLDYISPEQRQSPKEVDARADVYSAGALAYRMLTGSLPVGAFEPPRRLAPEVPAPLNDLVMAALAADKEKRPKDGGDMLRRLNETVPPGR